MTVGNRTEEFFLEEMGVEGFQSILPIPPRSSEMLKVHQREIHHIEGLFFAVTQLLHVAGVID